MTEPTAVDPPGCGCTECICGEHTPLDQATRRQHLDFFLGRLRDNTGLTRSQAMRLVYGDEHAERVIPAHMCTGTTCWTCGEPTELADMRKAIRCALSPFVGQDCHEYARIAATAIHDDVMRLLHERCDHQEIDPT